MRTTIIPAQITTVEDTIAGNLNLQQIVLLILSLFINTFIYSLLPGRMSFTLYKIPLMIVVFIVCVGLSIRIKQRIVLDWIIVFARYSIRPHLYFFNKNSQSFRSIIVEKAVARKVKIETALPNVKQIPTKLFSVDYTSLIRNQSLNIRFKRNSVQVVKNYD